MEESKESGGHGQSHDSSASTDNDNHKHEHCVSKSAQKKLLKLQRYQAKKAEKKAKAKENKRKKMEQKRQEWADKLAGLAEEERMKLTEAKADTRKERMAETLHQREVTRQKLIHAMHFGQNIVLDLDFSELMNSSQLSSLQQQIMYCYAANKKSSSPAHIWLTGCKGELGNRLKKVPGFDNWLVEKEQHSYIEALKERKDDLVYLTADSENVVQELETSKIYVIGGLVDRNRWKGITMQKAKDQGIQTAKLPIAEHLRMTSSQVLTVNQVFEILITYLEFKDWRKSLFQVIPQRKRSVNDSNDLTSESKKMFIYSDNNKEETSYACESSGGSKCNGKTEEVMI